MARYRSGTITIEAEDLLDQIEDEDLLDEVRRRDLHMETINDLDDVMLAYGELLRGRPAEALAILDRIVKPKWPTAEVCLEQYKIFMKPA